MGTLVDPLANVSLALWLKREQLSGLDHPRHTRRREDKYRTFLLRRPYMCAPLMYREYFSVLIFVLHYTFGRV